MVMKYEKHYNKTSLFGYVNIKKQSTGLWLWDNKKLNSYSIDYKGYEMYRFLKRLMYNQIILFL